MWETEGSCGCVGVWEGLYAWPFPVLSPVWPLPALLRNYESEPLFKFEPFALTEALQREEMWLRSQNKLVAEAGFKPRFE